MTVLVVAGAFALGVAAGWATGFVPALIRADPSPSPTASPVPSITATVAPVLPYLEPITRQLTGEDRDAGVTTTSVTSKAAGTISVVPGIGSPAAGAGDVRWVSIAVEDGVTINAAAFKAYVIATLNANRGWGTGHSVQFVATDGVADYRIVLASPYTAKVLCPDPHLTKPAGSFVEASPTPMPTPTPTSSPSPAVVDSPWSCAQDGVIVISSYNWTAGFPTYGTDYAGARAYILNHHMGHLLGHDDVECSGGRADVMVVQEVTLPDGCKVNPWPNPDAPAHYVDPNASPSPSPAALAP
ncbi:DUF3152 domain-containing protein [Demequina lutea]|uniref:DUF3152 domain-containing protein n=1 Tax=Demequina lutea TaxID=431489 RepID=A0A7Y9ZAN5_9MICO|nr:DUF3152 domain-containing protein [Demequina lutea]NYI40748.1 hypothetical protein [Demequina lutea]